MTTDLMPTDEQLIRFANELPQIFRDILAAFPKIEPGRKSGYGLAFQTLAIHFVNTDRTHSLGDVQEACERLAEYGFFEIKNDIFAHPTELGEKLIAAVTGGQIASRSGIPQLPKRTW